jgi:chemotaxis protein methyltransferase CheR
MDDDSLREILDFFELSWQGYRRVRKGVKKRLARHMLECGCRTAAHLLRLLQEDLEVRQKTIELLTVSISRFFRDLRLWEVLDHSILPILIREVEPDGSGPVRVWSAGCSCGEEVYSLKILWEGLETLFPALPPLELWASDSNPEVLEMARAGVYPPSSLENVTPARVSNCFVPVPGGFAVKEPFKSGVLWLQHDFITQAPPRAEFDLIFVRNNLLTYYEPALHIPAFLRMLDALRTGGFVIIGMNELIPVTEVRLKRWRECRCILRKMPVP